jgi:hypothetical protein
VVEIGCGAGNAVFPLLSSNRNPLLHLVACDYAPKAVKVVQARPFLFLRIQSPTLTDPLGAIAKPLVLEPLHWENNCVSLGFDIR